MVRGLWSQVLPQGIRGTPICSKSPLAGEYNRGLEFRLSFQLMIHLGQMMLPFLSNPCDKRYVGESQFSRLQGCPHCSPADITTWTMKGPTHGINAAASHTAAKVEVWELVKHEFMSTHTHFPDVCSWWSHWRKWHLPHTHMYTHTDITCSYAVNTVLCFPPGSPLQNPSWCREPPSPRSQPFPRRACIQWPLDMTSLPSHLNAEGPPQLQSFLWVSLGFRWDHLTS